MENTICKNCGKSVERKFCPDCGQSASVGRVDLRTILHEFAHGVVHVDKGILYTVRELTLRPGQTIRNYFDGKRVRLFKPFGYLVLFTTIYIFLTHMLGQSISYVNIESHGAESEEVIIQLEEKSEKLFKFLENNFSLITFCTIPLLSLLTLAFFRRGKYNYGEHLIMNGYIHGHQALLFIILIPLNYIWTPEVKQAIHLFLSLGVFVYMVAAVFNTYKMWKRILYSLLIHVVFLICIIVFVVIYLLIDIIGML